MARKRKRKAKRKVVKVEEPSTVLDTPEIPTDEVAPEAIEVVDISVDDDLDDADLRAQLIAEAAGLVSPPTEAEGDDAPPVTVEASPGTQPSGPDASPGLDAKARADAGLRRPAGPPNPRMTRDALVALSEMHAEGIARIAGELVVDLGEGSSPDDRDRLLAATLAQVEMQDAIYRVPTETGSVRRWKRGAALLILVVAGLVAVSPPGFVEPEPPPRLRASDRLHGVRVALLLEVQQIEAFRSREQRLPESLAEVDTALPDVRYVKSSNRLYQLVAYGPGGRAVVYDSASPEPEFDLIRRSWVTTRNAR